MSNANRIIRDRCGSYLTALGREGAVSVKLTNVGVYDVANHGVHVSDCDEGDNEVDLDLVNIFAADNQGDAIKVSEDDENPSLGDVKIRMSNIHTEGEVQIEEVDAGNLLVEIRDSVIGADEDDLKLSEIGDGNLEVWVTDTEIGKDVEIIEEGAGDLEVAITDSFVADDLEIKENDGGTATTDLSGTTIGDDVDVDGI